MDAFDSFVRHKKGNSSGQDLFSVLFHGSDSRIVSKYDSID